MSRRRESRADEKRDLPGEPRSLGTQDIDEPGVEVPGFAGRTLPWSGDATIPCELGIREDTRSVEHDIRLMDPLSTVLFHQKAKRVLAAFRSSNETSFGEPRAPCFQDFRSLENPALQDGMSRERFEVSLQVLFSGQQLVVIGEDSGNRRTECFQGRFGPDVSKRSEEPDMTPLPDVFADPAFLEDLDFPALDSGAETCFESDRTGTDDRNARPRDSRFGPGHERAIIFEGLKRCPLAVSEPSESEQILRLLLLECAGEKRRPVLGVSRPCPPNDA